MKYNLEGDNLNDWLIVRESVNKCGSDMYDIMKRYRGVSVLDKGEVERAATDIWNLSKKHGELAFAVCLTVFAGSTAPEASPFTLSIHSYFEDMPSDVSLKVERMRYHAKKLKEKETRIIKQFKKGI